MHINLSSSSSSSLQQTAELYSSAGSINISPTGRRRAAGWMDGWKRHSGRQSAAQGVPALYGNCIAHPSSIAKTMRRRLDRYRPVLPPPLCISAGYSIRRRRRRQIASFYNEPRRRYIPIQFISTRHCDKKSEKLSVRRGDNVPPRQVFLLFLLLRQLYPTASRAPEFPIKRPNSSHEPSWAPPPRAGPAVCCCWPVHRSGFRVLYGAGGGWRCSRSPAVLLMYFPSSSDINEA